MTLRTLRLKKGALDKFRLPVDVVEGELYLRLCELPTDATRRSSGQIHLVATLDEPRESACRCSGPPCLGPATTCWQTRCVPTGGEDSLCQRMLRKDVLTTGDGGLGVSLHEFRVVLVIPAAYVTRPVVAQRRKGRRQARSGPSNRLLQAWAVRQAEAAPGRVIR